MGGKMIVRGQRGGKKVSLRHVAQQGFTLVEMAIVLVIIGLIVGGILKGQEIVNNGRVKTQVAQVDAIKAAVETFRDQYNYYPGDDPLAHTQFGAVTALVGDGDGFVNQTAGAADADTVAAGVGEKNWVWYHLQLANLISGVIITPTGATPSATSLFTYEGKISSSYMYFGDFSWNTNVVVNKMIRIQNNNSDSAVPTPAMRETDAAQIDTKYDDGIPGTGQILASGSSAATNCCQGATCISANAVYGLAAGGSTASPYCNLLWQVE